MNYDENDLALKIRIEQELKEIPAEDYYDTILLIDSLGNPWELFKRE